VNELIFIVPPKGVTPHAPLTCQSNTEADNVTRHQIRDAVRCHFEPANRPKMIRFVHDEVLAT